MSGRPLALNQQRKKMLKSYSPEEEGRRMFERGEACPHNDTSHGKKHARWRGWQRAAMAARTAKKGGA